MKWILLGPVFVLLAAAMVFAIRESWMEYKYKKALIARIRTRKKTYKIDENGKISEVQLTTENKGV